MTDNTYIFKTDSTRVTADLAATKIVTTGERSHSEYVQSVDSSDKSSLDYKPLGHTILNADTVWLFIFTLIAGMTIGAVRARATSFFSQMMSLTISDFHWRSVTESMKLQYLWPSRLLNIAFYIITAIVIYEVFIGMGNTAGEGLDGIKLYGIILLLTLGYFIMKYSIHALIGFTFDIPEISSHIATCKLIASDIYGVVMLPVAMIFPFVPESGYMAMTIIASTAFVLLYFWRLLKSVKIILSDYLSFVYSILYLCTVEAIPLVCIYKLLMTL